MKNKNEKLINIRQYFLKSPSFYNFVRFVQLTKCYKIINKRTCQKQVFAFCKLTHRLHRIHFCLFFDNLMFLDVFDTLPEIAKSIKTPKLGQLSFLLCSHRSFMLFTIGTFPYISLFPLDKDNCLSTGQYITRQSPGVMGLRLKLQEISPFQPEI